ncbi:MAG: gliding motility-related protein [Flavipsychrobacter sp.]|nr:gliding motility-related protein [Flavipsychrobacter sp.]
MFLFILGQGTNSFASHIFGGELLYTRISGDTYRVYLTLYADCGAAEALFQSLYDATPTVTVTDGINPMVLTLNIIERGTDVSPVCKAEIGNTKCTPGGTLPGVRRFIYDDTITLPYPDTKWTFLFKGGMGSFGSAGRSGSITNVLNPLPGSSTLMQLEAYLDNTTEYNSSPVYSSIPTPFSCVKVPQEYNQGAIDADGDSLVFSMVPAIDANSAGMPISYLPPFSAELPLATDAGTFKFNAINGQISFVPSIIQDALVVCKVSEYRKGVLIGTSERELTFVVLDDCKGIPPTPSLNAVSGGAITGPNVITVCAGTEDLSFGIKLANPDRDITTIETSTLPGSSTLDIINDNTTDPYASFHWVTGNIPIGIYTFYITIKNDHCPIANRQTVAYTINITQKPELSYNLIAPTQCLHKAFVQYNLKYGYTPRTLTIMSGNDSYKTYTDSTGTIIDSLPQGPYTMITSANGVCKVSAAIVIPDSGDLPLSPVIKDYCINGPTGPIEILPIGTGAIITWYDPAGAPIYYPPIPDTKAPGSEYYYFTEQYHQCLSAKIPVTTTVHQPPVTELLAASKPETICLGDTIMLQATGGVTYTWTPRDLILSDPAGHPYIRVTTPVAIQVKAIDSFGCSDSVTYNYKDIQYCCQFSYPNAFTPNRDGVNDGFKIVSYGNLTQYNLVIFNRWGQEVFETTDPRQYWDGTFNGIPCDMGNYYYYFKANCLAGNKEESKGDVLLIR